MTENAPEIVPAKAANLKSQVGLSIMHLIGINETGIAAIGFPLPFQGSLDPERCRDQSVFKKLNASYPTVA